MYITHLTDKVLVYMYPQILGAIRNFDLSIHAGDGIFRLTALSVKLILSRSV